MPAVPYDQAEIEAAVARLSEEGRLREAEGVVAAAAPALARIIAGALGSGGWFGKPHNDELAKAAAVADARERAAAIAALVAEETRIAMMVGVAVGWGLREELERSEGSGPEDAS